MAGICVIHLAREANGAETFRAFLESYNKTRISSPAHDLLILFKGFDKFSFPAAYTELLCDVPHKEEFFPDRGYDIGPYFHAARKHHYDYYCFLNSYCRIRDDGWLSKLHDHITRDGVGLVGATGSYESFLTDLEYHRGTLAPWNRLFLARDLLLYRSSFPPFPNPHIRTNAFMISGRTLAHVRVPRITTKFDVHRFESGKTSLSRQVSKMDLSLLVVGKDGKGYTAEEWGDSHTFRRGEQENLLVADNQTEQYAAGDPSLRADLTARAWGRIG